MDETEQKNAIRLSDLAFTWPGRAGFLLKVPDFRVSDGGKVFLLGESGSGKSTLLSLICGIATPDSGKIEIDGTEQTTLTASARDKFRANRIGIIFQMFNLLPYATPLQNVLLPLTFSSERKSSIADPYAEALRLTQALGLSDDLVTKARSAELSIGQQQRVAAARALIGGPRLIIADEPTSALDENSQSAFIDVLMEQVESAGATLLMVSHNARLSSAFDRVVDISEITGARKDAA